MRNFKKITMAVLAGAMALTATCVSVFAEEDVVLSVLNDDGIMIDYTKEEIDSLGGCVPMYGGIIADFNVDTDNLSILRSARSTGYFTLTSVPGTSNKYNIYNAVYEGSFNIPAGKYCYSNSRMETDTNSGAKTANINMSIDTEKGNNGNYIYDYGNKLKAMLYVSEMGNSPVATLSVTTNDSITYRNLDINYTYYVRIGNNSDYPGNGTMAISAR